ncbi:NnrS family protein [Palleronia sp.]|uniref:NnrS family protein n=1 Tax=Palleronia sp. TaxID=1940284 RepID=UPI0035C82881
MERIARPSFRGSAFFSYGFRPFFLGAVLFAFAVVPAWLLILAARFELHGPFAPVDWHAHEMLFGYGSAVLAGFLFTAVPNWTKRPPVKGLPLALLLALWILGRLAVAGVIPLPPAPVLLIDASFLALVLAVIAKEIVAAQNWRNLLVVLPISLFLGADILFHAEVQATGTSEFGRRLGFATLVFLIMLIGGRIIPSFTRNWLTRRGPGPLPAALGWFDALALAVGAASQLVWVVTPVGAATGVALLLAAILHLARVARWRGWRTFASPLLTMLHVAYVFVPLGLAALAVSALTGTVPLAVGLHLLGIGAIGGMTLAVMMRATMGHTGRALVAGPVLTVAFALVGAAALIRALAGTVVVAGVSGTSLAGLLWVAAFGLFAARLAPSLVAPARISTPA